jgi:hypothetical protein
MYKNNLVNCGYVCGTKICPFSLPYLPTKCRTGCGGIFCNFFDPLLLWVARVTIAGLGTRVARFFLAHDTKTGKMYQMRISCTKWS